MNTQCLIENRTNGSTPHGHDHYGCTNTNKAKESDLKYFWTWAKVAHQKTESYPVPYDIIVDFVVSHLEGKFPKGVEDKLLSLKIKSSAGKHKLSTIHRRLSSLRWKHRQLGIPKEQSSVDSSIKSITNKAEHDPANVIKSSLAVSKNIIIKVLKSIPDDLIGKRDRALFAVTWASGRRRSEILSMTMEKMEIHHDINREFYIFNFTSLFSGDKTRMPVNIIIGGKAKRYLDDWLDASQIRSGYIFRQITKGGKSIKANPISGTQFYRVVKQRFVESGIESIDRLSPHSLRSGFVTELGNLGIKIHDGMPMSGHKCMHTFMGYYMAGIHERYSAVNILDDD